jgi:MFS family permease
VTSLRTLLRIPSFALYLASRVPTMLAVQIQTVAVGAQVYGLTHDPLDLGLVGLSQFLPFLVCVLPAGQLADRVDRRLILAACLLLELVCSIALVLFSVRGLTSAWPIFAVMVPFGIARAVMSPAAQAVLPNLVAREQFASAVALNSSLWQFTTIVGPAVGGYVYAGLGPSMAYAMTAVMMAAGLWAVLAMRTPPQTRSDRGATLRSVGEGLAFVWRRRPVLGAISLDLFAVLFGGAVALLPAYATDVLHVGPQGLGWLRAAPGMGAALMGAWLTIRPIRQRAGFAMFAGVAIFGLATIVFGLSRSFIVSMCALAVLGAADMVSVFVRHLLVQLETPDEMRGRVGAVSSMFIGASNELGEFESGLTAAWWGLVPAVVVGGAMTLMVVVIWVALFPQLRKLDRFAQH